MRQRRCGGGGFLFGLDRGLRPKFLQDGLKKDNDQEGKRKNEQKLPLGARFLLRIFVFGQSVLTVQRLRSGFLPASLIASI